MRNLRWYDWLGGLALWTAATFLVGVVLDETGAPEEGTIIVTFGLWSLGVVAARVWALRRPEEPKTGLSTGEAQLARLEELEMRMLEMETLHQRMVEVEDRLDFSERLLAREGQRQLPDRVDG